jgi:two-component system response regulator
MNQNQTPDSIIDILLVEDSADDAAFVRHALEEANLGVQLHIARDGAEALSLLFGGTAPVETAPLFRPRVIVLDLKLPKVNGLEVLRRLKTNQHARSIPVVVLSSSQENSDLIASYEANVNSFLVKPMDFDEFRSLVQALGRYWIQCNQVPKH